MQICSSCGQYKPVTSFGKNRARKNGLSSKCKKCSRNYASDRLEQRKQWYNDYKNTLSCSKCGFSNPIALDFHHLYPNEKDMTISKMVRNGKQSIEDIRLEMARCIVLCSNCHRILHAEEKPCEEKRIVQLTLFPD
jgi:Zn ribbon nucleic-acid-binding protein